jgi:hypothetical protein
VPGLVTLHLWGVSRRHVPWALGRMALGRRALRTLPGLRFARLLGTSHGRSFTPSDADPRHWGLLTCWNTAAEATAFDDTSYAAGWDGHSDERLRLALQPLSSTGRWSGQEPFGPERPSADGSGPCAILTRARLVPKQAMTFWRAVPPVAASLPHSPGLRFARGIGEAPIGLQATFSVWDDLAAAKQFAYTTAAHREVVRQTPQAGWYAEQLFARFAVLDARGEVDGRNPLESGGCG